MFVLKNFIIAAATIGDYALSFAQIVIIIRALLSWVNPDPFNPIVQLIHRITEPLLAPFRRIIPAHASGIDFSALFALIAIVFLKLFFVRTLLDIAYRVG